jgi:hypothetical protein
MRYKLDFFYHFKELFTGSGTFNYENVEANLIDDNFNLMLFMSLIRI